MADDFFTRQLPQNVTWALTLLYAMDSKGEFSDTNVQVRVALAHLTSSAARLYILCLLHWWHIQALGGEAFEDGGGARALEHDRPYPSATRLRADHSLLKVRTGWVASWLGVSVIEPTSHTRCATAGSRRSGRSKMVMRTA